MRSPEAHGSTLTSSTTPSDQSSNAGHLICTTTHSRAQRLPHSLLSISPHTPSSLQLRLIVPL